MGPFLHVCSYVLCCCFTIVLHFPDDEYFTIVLHHGGSFSDSQYKIYGDGETSYIDY